MEDGRRENSGTEASREPIADRMTQLMEKLAGNTAENGCLVIVPNTESQSREKCIIVPHGVKGGSGETTYFVVTKHGFKKIDFGATPEDEVNLKSFEHYLGCLIEESPYDDFNRGYYPEGEIIVPVSNAGNFSVTDIGKDDAPRIREAFEGSKQMAQQKMEESATAANQAALDALQGLV